MEDLKKKVNNLVNAANAVVEVVKFQQAVGDYDPDFYGNVKTPKLGNTLRPIILQIPTPTYQLAKQLSKLILPYIPTKVFCKIYGRIY